jgi:DNA-binding beta-propeller fold protein YncE
MANSKYQANAESKIPMTKTLASHGGAVWNLRFHAWNLFGIGCLRFGTYSLLALILAAVGCGPQRGGPLRPTGTPLMWPEPPERPRIAYLGAVSTEADMQRRGSPLEGLGELLFGKKPIGVLVSPYAVAVDEAGVMYVADSGGAVVHAFDLKMRGYRQFSALGKEGKLQTPIGLALLGNRIYVADSGLRQVCVFKNNGEFLFAFGQDRFTRPAGIACGDSLQSAIYVADAGRHAIAVFDREGAFLGHLGSRGIGAGQFNFPTHLWIDRAGQLYVSDTLNYRIQVFGPDGRFLWMFGQQGDRPGNFAHPCGVASDSLGNIYVTDRQFENIQIFDAQGQILMALGQEGNEPGEFWLPAGICTDLHNRIYVADSFNKRIQIFELLEEMEP